jgi:hypothetical protein
VSQTPKTSDVAIMEDGMVSLSSNVRSLLKAGIDLVELRNLGLVSAAGKGGGF